MKGFNGWVAVEGSAPLNTAWIDQRATHVGIVHVPDNLHVQRLVMELPPVSFKNPNKDQHINASRKAVWDYLQKISPWTVSNDMPWEDEIICGISLIKQHADNLQRDLDNVIGERDILLREIGHQVGARDGQGILDAVCAYVNRTHFPKL